MANVKVITFTEETNPSSWSTNMIVNDGTNYYVNTPSAIYSYDVINHSYTLLYTKTTETSIYATIRNHIMFIARFTTSRIYLCAYNLQTGVYTSDFTSYNVSSTGTQVSFVCFMDSYVAYRCSYLAGAGRWVEYLYAIPFNYESASSTFGTAKTSSTATSGSTTIAPSALWVYNNELYGYGFRYGGQRWIHKINITSSPSLTQTAITQITENIPDITYPIGTYLHGSIVTLFQGTSQYEFNHVNQTWTKTDNVTNFAASGSNLAKFGAGTESDFYMTSPTGLYHIAYVVYNITYSIKNNSGDNTYATDTNAAPLTEVRFGFANNVVSYRYTTLDGVITGTFTSVPPSGKRLVGFATTPNKTIATFDLNADIPYITESDTTFYEVYERYNPPGTTFDINLYNNTAEPNRVDKSSYLTDAGTLSGALREECTITSPSILIQRTTVPTFNYVYIPAFNRYYFVTGITSVRYKLWRIDLKCDVLMTYKTGVLALSAIIARQENDYNADLNDTDLPVQKDVTIDIHESTTTPFDTTTDTAVHSYVLVVVGA